MKHNHWYFLIIGICLKFVITVSKAVNSNGIDDIFSQPINFDDLNKKLNEASETSDSNWNDNYQLNSNNAPWNDDILNDLQFPAINVSVSYPGVYEKYAKQAEETNERNHQAFLRGGYLWYPLCLLLGIFVVKICVFLAYKRRETILARTTIYSRTISTLSPSQTQLPSQTETLSQSGNLPSYDDVINVPQNIPLFKK